MNEEKERKSINSSYHDMITNHDKNKTAVALSYDPSNTAPKIIASGKGYLAEKIITKAKETSIPIHKDDKLAKTISKLEVGDFIPPELYGVVAEVLVFIDNMDNLKKKLYT